MYTFMLNDPSQMLSPSLLIGWATVQSNLRRMLAMAGSPNRLRPHMKTHKTKDITQLYQSQGITRHKCATLREAEVLAECGAANVLIAYPMVGPNQGRVCELAKRFPQTRFNVLGDDREMILELDLKVGAAGVSIGLFLDFNVGQDRTGLVSGESLHPLLEQLKHLQLSGLHLYDGQNTSLQQADRKDRVHKTYQRGAELRSRLQAHATAPLEIVLGGTPSFMLYAHEIHDPHVSLSPGTCILHDAGYGQKYPELGFEPAAAVLVRCISRPGPKLVTFDVGTKAIASDPPFGQRVHLVGLETAKCTLHNEEHYVVETERADHWKPGMVTYAIPMHVCPTVALYDRALVVEEGKVAKVMEISARGR